MDPHLATRAGRVNEAALSHVDAHMRHSGIFIGTHKLAHGHGFAAHARRIPGRTGINRKEHQIARTRFGNADQYNDS